MAFDQTERPPSLPILTALVEGKFHFGRKLIF